MASTNIERVKIDFAGVAAGEKILVLLFPARADRETSMRKTVRKERLHQRAFCSSFLEG
jgi:hypothetical protein